MLGGAFLGGLMLILLLVLFNQDKASTDMQVGPLRIVDLFKGFIASGVLALGCLAGWLMPNTTGILVLAALGGIGFGSYMAVDIALVVDILPRPEDAAKDFGVINIANNVPQMLAPGRHGP